MVHSFTRTRFRVFRRSFSARPIVLKPGDSDAHETTRIPYCSAPGVAGCRAGGRGKPRPPLGAQSGWPSCIPSAGSRRSAKPNAVIDSAAAESVLICATPPFRRRKVRVKAAWRLIFQRLELNRSNTSGETPPEPRPMPLHRITSRRTLKNSANRRQRAATDYQALTSTRCCNGRHVPQVPANLPDRFSGLPIDSGAFTNACNGSSPITALIELPRPRQSTQVCGPHPLGTRPQPGSAREDRARLTPSPPSAAASSARDAQRLHVRRVFPHLLPDKPWTASAFTVAAPPR